MIGSVIVDAVLARVLGSDPDVTDAVGDQLYGTDAVPPFGTLPALLFYMPTPSQYDGAMSSIGDYDVYAETLTYNVVAYCDGTSYGPILPAMRAQMRALSGQTFEGETDDEGRRYTVTFTLRGETPMRTRTPNPGQFYRALGAVYDVEVTRED